MEIIGAKVNSASNFILHVEIKFDIYVFVLYTE